jgi:hypothetical protein
MHIYIYMSMDVKKIYVDTRYKTDDSVSDSDFSSSYRDHPMPPKTVFVILTISLYR